MHRHTIRVAALLAGLLLAIATLDTPPSLAQAPTAGVFAITNARIIDGTGRPAIERGTLLVSDGRITAVGSTAAVRIPPGAQRIDAAGKTVVPGFMCAPMVRLAATKGEKSGILASSTGVGTATMIMWASPKSCAESL